MERSSLISKIMFEYEQLDREQIVEWCQTFPPKVIRWLGAHHPDNRTRKIFYEITGVLIGVDTVINQNFVVFDSYKKLLKIGKRVAIASNVTVVCDSAPNNSGLKNNPYVAKNMICSKEVIIGDDVWVGAGAIILPAVTINRGSVVGAGAVVSRDVPADTVVAGVPAVSVRRLVRKVRKRSA
jgi:acetyltransferase-like isoleucine patch superfamily enzyme